MRENWIMPNRRALGFGCVPPLLLAGAGAWLACGPANFAGTWARWVGPALVLAGTALLALMLWHLCRPRIAYRDGKVAFYLRAAQPIHVPVALVEAFFLGQGPANLPGTARRERTVNLVARLAQRQTEWAARPVNPALGNWSEGYITIRGTWCEPLGPETIRRLNRRLHEVKKSSP